MWSDELRQLQLAAPPPDADIAARVKRANIEIYDQISEEYDHHDGLRPYGDTVLFLRALANDSCTPHVGPAPRVAVDVGCANGAGLELGSRAFDFVVGVDLSLQALKQVHARGFLAVMADCERLPFAPGSIDVVTCIAAMHHFPDPGRFMASGFDCLRAGGVLLTGNDPSADFMRFGPLAKLVWDLRKPVYRALSSRGMGNFYLHTDKDFQELNDLAEFGRTAGGFTDERIESMFVEAGFEDVRVFHGIDPSGSRRYDVPPWKHMLLKTLSAQNPLKRSNWVNLTGMGRRNA
jgi:SAM-dependent methyltransferase